eukprot:IDg9069t1
MRCGGRTYDSGIRNIRWRRNVRSACSCITRHRRAADEDEMLVSACKHTSAAARTAAGGAVQRSGYERHRRAGRSCSQCGRSAECAHNIRGKRGACRVAVGVGTDAVPVRASLSRAMAAARASLHMRGIPRSRARRAYAASSADKVQHRHVQDEIAKKPVCVSACRGHVRPQVLRFITRRRVYLHPKRDCEHEYAHTRQKCRQERVERERANKQHVHELHDPGHEHEEQVRVDRPYALWCLCIVRRPHCAERLHGTRRLLVRHCTQCSRVALWQTRTAATIAPMGGLTATTHCYYTHAIAPRDALHASNSSEPTCLSARRQRESANTMAPAGLARAGARPLSTAARAQIVGARTATARVTDTGGSGLDATSLSSSVEEARGKAVTMYRQVLRDIPAMREDFTIIEDELFVRRVVRYLFDRHSHVSDPKIIDMLVFKARQEAAEIRNQWKSRYHVYQHINAYRDEMSRRKAVEVARAHAHAPEGGAPAHRQLLVDGWKARGLVPA